MAYDLEVLRTMKEKQEFLEKIVENNYVLFFQHDMLYECTTIVKTEKGFRMGTPMTLKEFVSLP